MEIYDINGTVIATGGSGSSPIAGKRIALLGDSNTQYSADNYKTHMEETYGCTFFPLGKAGFAWETTGGTAPGETKDESAVGRVNAIIANVDENKLITEYDAIILMFGTNVYNAGKTTDTADNVATACGAMRYCFQKLCYYGRNIPIGVIIPICTPIREEITAIATEFGLPMIDLEKEVRIIGTNKTPDGTNWYTDGGNHFGAQGIKHVCRVMGKWIAYEL
jgi:hypothetical protein